MTTHENSCLTPSQVNSSMWYGEYGITKHRDGDTKHAVCSSNAKTLNQREPDYLYKKLEEAKEHIASALNAVAMVKDKATSSSKPDDTSVLVSSDNRGVSSGYVGGRSYHENGTGDVFRKINFTKKLQGLHRELSEVHKKPEDEMKAKFTKVGMKLPIVKRKDEVDDDCQGGSSLISKTSSFPLPSLPSKHKQLPKTLTKPWRQRVTVSWSEGCTSIVTIEDIHRVRSGKVSLQETKTDLTREHLRRFIIKERR